MLRRWNGGSSRKVSASFRSRLGVHSIWNGFTRHHVSASFRFAPDFIGARVPINRDRGSGPVDRRRLRHLETRAKRIRALKGRNMAWFKEHLKPPMNPDKSGTNADTKLSFLLVYRPFPTSRD
jgi:hypothetical protein